MSTILENYRPLQPEAWWSGTLITSANQEDVAACVSEIASATGIGMSGYFREESGAYHLTRVRRDRTDIVESPERLHSALLQMQEKIGGNLCVETAMTANDIRIILGMREGYTMSADAITHDVAEILLELPANVQTENVRIIAKPSRQPLYEEPALLIEGHPDILQTITDIAYRLRQLHFIVEDPAHLQTVTYENTSA